ncbi:MAG: tRNA 2-thiocytidine(32) synthetase TtcA [Deltaproteobacteria bacterium]|nr:tRNA 2-thiocytidine(32) synthetase TtcA [Deltaproteobacteria bacterium]
MARERHKGIVGTVKRRLGRALSDYAMTADGDTLLVALSGGKDSLALLHILQTRKKWIPISYQLRPVHVLLGESEDGLRLERLNAQVAALGLRLELIETDIAARLRRDDLPENPCFHCSRWKRRALFDFAEKNGLRKLAFGHHRDDILETALLNLFYGSSFSTMRPRQELLAGRMTIIRPLAYLDEAEVVAYCRQHGLPIDSPPCAHRLANGKRNIVKTLLNDLQKDNAKVKNSLFHALHNVREEYLLGSSPIKYRPQENCSQES